MTFLKKMSSLVRYAPFYWNEEDSGFDLEAVIDGPMFIPPLGRVIVPCGLAFEVPHGHELQVRPRSGLFIKHGIMAVFGTVDNGFRGEVKVMLINLGEAPYTVFPQDRIAQGVISKVGKTGFKFMSELTSTDRGAEGYGSTGA